MSPVLPEVAQGRPGLVWGALVWAAAFLLGLFLLRASFATQGGVLQHLYTVLGVVVVVVGVGAGMALCVRPAKFVRPAFVPPESTEAESAEVVS